MILRSIVKLRETARGRWKNLNNRKRAKFQTELKLNQDVAGEFAAHEIMEAFASKQGQQDFQLAHAYANKFFGDVRVEQIGGLPEGAQTATTARATLNFRRLQTKVSIEITLTTPQPAESLPNRFDYLQGNIRVLKPNEKQE